MQSTPYLSLWVTSGSEASLLPAGAGMGPQRLPVCFQQAALQLQGRSLDFNPLCCSQLLCNTMCYHLSSREGPVGQEKPFNVLLKFTGFWLSSGTLARLWRACCSSPALLCPVTLRKGRVFQPEKGFFWLGVFSTRGICS